LSGERVLVVDDDLSLRQMLSILLRREGYEVDVAASAEEGLSRLARSEPALVITDLNMPGMNGLDLLREIKARAANSASDVEVVVITAHDGRGVGAEAIREGAADYLTKPFDNNEMRIVARQVLRVSALRRENRRLRKELGKSADLSGLLGRSSAMDRVRDLVMRVKDARINCLIQGESGTGKEMVARTIHYSGSRGNGPFVAVNCGAIPESLLESELFGYKRGAFTGAVRDKVGLIQAAHRGTLFLDEVNSLPPSAQVTLLRALQERRITPVGDVHEIEVDVRIVAASNADLQAEVEGGRFREDLFYRLNVVQIDLPALRNRADDVPELARHFVQRFAAEYGRHVVLSPEALRVLEAWSFPGNVRELQNVIERAVALSAGGAIGVDDLPERMRARVGPARVDERVDFPEEGVDIDGILNGIEQQWLKAALEAADGNKTRAAQLLNITFRSFRYRLAKHGMAGDDG